MASVFVMTSPPSDIYYSLADNRVRSFKLRGVLLYDEDKNISQAGWKDQLVAFVKEQRLNINDGRGLHAFVYGLIDAGLIEAE
ncbi:MAG: hypothetical protein SV062_07475 [Thermodesulfobacteriota bacterium]|nr:hypothetical protein [Thermodesulfobacteriota bacterium]